MTTQDLDLIKQVSEKVMGWKISDKPLELADEAGPYFFIVDEKPTKGETYETKVVLRNHGLSPYGITWHAWNPIERPQDWTMVIEKLMKSGHKIAIEFNPETPCVIGNDWLVIHYQGVNPGAAICVVALGIVARGADYEQ